MGEAELALYKSIEMEASLPADLDQVWVVMYECNPRSEFDAVHKHSELQYDIYKDSHELETALGRMTRLISRPVMAAISEYIALHDNPILVQTFSQPHYVLYTSPHVATQKEIICR